MIPIKDKYRLYLLRIVIWSHDCFKELFVLVTWNNMIDWNYEYWMINNRDNNKIKPIFLNNTK